MADGRKNEDVKVIKNPLLRQNIFLEEISGISLIVPAVPETPKLNDNESSEGLGVPHVGAKTDAKPLETQSFTDIPLDVTDNTEETKEPPPPSDKSEASSQSFDLRSIIPSFVPLLVPQTFRNDPPKEPEGKPNPPTVETHGLKRISTPETVVPELIPPAAVQNITPVPTFSNFVKKDILPPDLSKSFTSSSVPLLPHAQLATSLPAAGAHVSSIPHQTSPSASNTQLVDNVPPSVVPPQACAFPSLATAPPLAGSTVSSVLSFAGLDGNSPSVPLLANTPLTSTLPTNSAPTSSARPPSVPLLPNQSQSNDSLVAGVRGTSAPPTAGILPAGTPLPDAQSNYFASLPPPMATGINRGNSNPYALKRTGTTSYAPSVKPVSCFLPPPADSPPVRHSPISSVDAPISSHTLNTFQMSGTNAPEKNTPSLPFAQISSQCTQPSQPFSELEKGQPHSFPSSALASLTSNTGMISTTSTNATSAPVSNIGTQNLQTDFSMTSGFQSSPSHSNSFASNLSISSTSEATLSHDQRSMSTSSSLPTLPSDADRHSSDRSKSEVAECPKPLGKETASLSSSVSTLSSFSLSAASPPPPIIPPPASNINRAGGINPYKLKSTSHQSPFVPSQEAIAQSVNPGIVPLFSQSNQYSFSTAPYSALSGPQVNESAENTDRSNNYQPQKAETNTVAGLVQNVQSFTSALSSFISPNKKGSKPSTPTPSNQEPVSSSISHILTGIDTAGSQYYPPMSNSSNQPPLFQPQYFNNLSDVNSNLGISSPFPVFSASSITNPNLSKTNELKTDNTMCVSAITTVLSSVVPPSGITTQSSICQDSSAEHSNISDSRIPNLERQIDPPTIGNFASQSLPSNTTDSEHRNANFFNSSLYNNNTADNQFQANKSSDNLINPCQSADPSSLNTVKLAENNSNNLQPPVSLSGSEEVISNAPVVSFYNPLQAEEVKNQSFFNTATQGAETHYLLNTPSQTEEPMNDFSLRNTSNARQSDTNFPFIPPPRSEQDKAESLINFPPQIQDTDRRHFFSVSSQFEQVNTQLSFPEPPKNKELENSPANASSSSENVPVIQPIPTFNYFSGSQGNIPPPVINQPPPQSKPAQGLPTSSFFKPIDSPNISTGPHPLQNYLSGINQSGPYSLPASSAPQFSFPTPTSSYTSNAAMAPNTESSAKTDRTKSADAEEELEQIPLEGGAVPLYNPDYISKKKQGETQGGVGNSYRLGAKKPTYAPVPDLRLTEKKRHPEDQTSPSNASLSSQEEMAAIEAQGRAQTRVGSPSTSGKHSPSHPSITAIDAYISDLVQPSYRPPYHHWFYKTGRHKKSPWTPFSMADSLNLEQVYSSSELKEDTKVPTDGGRYDVEIVSRKKTSVYWDEPSGEVRRCSWFVKSVPDSRFVPYDENIAALLEDEYKKGCETGEWNRRVELGDGEVIILHSPTAMAHHVRSGSPDVWGAQPTLQTTKPRVVKRGVEDFNIEKGEPKQVDHLLLMVHGVGKACDLRFRSLVEVVDDFRNIAQQLVSSHFHSGVENGNVGRVEILPVEWHGALHTEAINDRLSAITLPSIPRAREFTNETLLDILFYTSPVFAERIVEAVGEELNRVFTLYRSRNPGFRGEVSLGGHSLGSLILFDILCHQKVLPPHLSTQASLQSEDEEEARDELGFLEHSSKARLSRRMSYLTIGPGTGQPYTSYPQLLFQPKNFFALGSPIGMFVTVRGLESLGEDFKFPTCPAFFNIFHPNDPVAYRIEALIKPELATVPAVLIPHHKGRKRMHLELKETMAHLTGALKQKLVDSMKNTWNAFYQLAFFNRKDNALQGDVNKVIEDEVMRDLDSDPPLSVIGEEEAGSDVKVGKLNGGRRVDYVLQEAPLETFNQYISAIRSHLVYWESHDTTLMMLKEIYGSMGISPDTQVPQGVLPFDLASDYSDFTYAIGATPTQFVRK